MTLIDMTSAEVLQMGIKELFETLHILELENYPNIDEVIKKSSYGIDIKFPIYWLWKNTNKILSKHKDNQVAIDGIAYFEDSFEIEKENRRALMRYTLLKAIEEQKSAVKGMEEEDSEDEKS